MILVGFIISENKGFMAIGKILTVLPLRRRIKNSAVHEDETYFISRLFLSITQMTDRIDMMITAIIIAMPFPAFI